MPFGQAPVTDIELRLFSPVDHQRMDEDLWPVISNETPTLDECNIEVVKRIRAKVIRLLQESMSAKQAFNIKRQNLTRYRTPSYLQHDKVQAKLLNLRNLLEVTTQSLIERSELPQVKVNKGERIDSMNIVKGE